MSDPTGTIHIRQDFRREMAARLREIRGDIRDYVGYEEDQLNLTGNVDRRKLQQFRRWLAEQIDKKLLRPVIPHEAEDGQHWTAPYIREAYEKGWENASERLDRQGFRVPDVSDLTTVPVATRQLAKLYNRTFNNIHDASEGLKQDLREGLAEGLAQGHNPRKIADDLTERTRKNQKQRFETIARTEVINSHSEAALDRFESAGVDTVQHGEWSTAGDDDVCPICQALDGREFNIEQMRHGAFEFVPGEDDYPSLAGFYQLKPPAHPNGRCTILPVIL